LDFISIVCLEKLDKFCSAQVLVKTLKDHEAGCS